MTPNKIVYRNRSFLLQTNGRYYIRSIKRKCDERLLHRQIYVDNFGPIPDGMVVHHKDGDWTNNDPSNLELKDNGQHHREHALQWHRKNREKSKLMMDAVRSKASEWHRSEAGREYHRNASRKAALARPYSDYTCKCCGVGFKSRSFGHVAFCSNKCRWKMKGKPRNT